MATQANSTSFGNTPQATHAFYWWTEDELIASGLLSGNIVMVIDLRRGGAVLPTVSRHPQ
jgi:hypothetical protein